MLTKEQIEEMAKAGQLPSGEVGLYAQESKDHSQVEITVFTINGRKLCVVDILASLSHFQLATIHRKLEGNLTSPWQPGENSPAPVPKRGIYWGET